MRLLVAECTVTYRGRLSAHLPRATRLIMFKSDGSVLIHSDGGSYKPLNWMSPPCVVRENAETAEFVVTNKSGETLSIEVHQVHSDNSHELGVDPGLMVTHWCDASTRPQLVRSTFFAKALKVRQLQLKSSAVAKLMGLSNSPDT
jgi:RecB family endonuclease NucS